MNDQIIIGVAGMPGAGKTTVAEVAKRMHYDVVVMGDEVREETKKRKMEPTPDNVGAVMLELRQEEGPAVVAHRCIPKIEARRKRGVVIDGIRSPYETEAFKQHFPAFIVLALHSSPETRFKRLFQRNRSDDPASWEVFSARDWRELQVGLGNVIALADAMIVNEATRTQLKKQVQVFLGEVASR